LWRSGWRSFRSVYRFGFTEPPRDQIEIMLCGCDAMRGLLLKTGWHINRASEPDGIYGAVGIAIVLLDDLQNSCPAESPQRFRPRWLSTMLHRQQVVANVLLYLLRKGAQFITAGANEFQWPQSCFDAIPP
jgi:hypothetical protein